MKLGRDARRGSPPASTQNTAVRRLGHQLAIRRACSSSGNFWPTMPVALAALRQARQLERPVRWAASVSDHSTGRSRSRTVIRPSRAAFLMAASHTRRTISDKGESTRSDVLNPDCARTYSLRRLATIKTSVGISGAAFPEDSVRTMRLRPRLRCSPFAGLVPSSRLSGAVCSTAQASR